MQKEKISSPTQAHLNQGSPLSFVMGDFYASVTSKENADEVKWSQTSQEHRRLTEQFCLTPVLGRVRKLQRTRLALRYPEGCWQRTALGMVLTYMGHLNLSETSNIFSMIIFGAYGFRTHS